MQEVIYLLVGMASAGLTYWLHHRYPISPVLASSMLALVVAVLCLLLPETYSNLAQTLPFVAIGGTFVGMSTRKRVKGIGAILFAGLLFALIFNRSSTLFEGFGGALGTSACVSVLGVIGVRRLFGKSKVLVKKQKAKIDLVK